MNKLLIVAFSLASGALFADFNSVTGQALHSENESQLYYSSLPYAIARQGQRAVNPKATVVGYAEFKERVYSISNHLELVTTRKDGRNVIDNWALTRWEHQYISPLAIQQYANINAKYPPEFSHEINSTGVGCLAKTPLRYGDIENDDENELVLMLGGLFVVFSPEHEQITFSEYLEERDLLHPELHQRKYGDDVPDEAQFVSNLAFINGYPVSPAMRFYTKVYVGDFNSNGNSDILVWRKGYLSSRGDDSIDGFVLKEQSWSHYERDLEAQAESESGITGEYLPQETAEAEIQIWLSENDLTWSKGYPSKSECAGEEGQLIPEMHDPLLNDPDVLQ